MITLIGAEKGGTGKTTVATNLAAIRSKKNDVMLLDTDTQGSATYWISTRDDSKIKPLIFCAQRFGRIDTEISKLSKKFDDVIIDAGGRDSEELRSAMLVADRVYIPVQPSQFDVWTINSMANMVQKAIMFNPKMKAYILLNRASTNPSVSELDETIKILSDIEHLNLSASIIKDRIAFRKAAREGLSVTEMKPPDQKAINEINNLYKEIFS